MTAGWVPSWDDSYGPVPISALPEIYDAGYRVWMRYGALGGAGKHWTPAELAAWFACGPDTGVVGLVEGTGTEPVDNPASGAAHARAARAAYRALGWSDSVALVPAMDENVTSAQWHGPLVQYLRNWNGADTVRPVFYVEADAGAYLDALGLTAGTFTPAAYGWESPARTAPYSPTDAPAHVVMTQEHNGRNLYGGNIDTGHTRLGAPCVYWNPKGLPDMNWSDQVVDSGDPNNPKWSVSGMLGWAVTQLRTLVGRSGAAATGAAVTAVSTKLDSVAAAVAALAKTTSPAPAIDYDALAAALLRALIAQAGK